MVVEQGFDEREGSWYYIRCIMCGLVWDPIIEQNVRRQRAFSTSTKLKLLELLG